MFYSILYLATAWAAVSKIQKDESRNLGRDAQLVIALGCPVAAYSDQSGHLSATRSNVVEDESPQGRTSSPQRIPET